MLVYTICTVIDILRIRFLEKAFMSVIDRLDEKIMFFSKNMLVNVTKELFGESSSSDRNQELPRRKYP